MKNEYINKVAIAACMGFAFLTGTGLAQNKPSDEVAPKPVPPLRESPSVTTPPSLLNKSAEDSQVLLDNLKGVVLVPQPTQVQAHGSKEVGVNIEGGLVVPSEKSFKKLVAGFVNKPLTHGALNKLVHDIIVFYRGHDLPVVDVIVPQQDITSGTIQLAVLEAHVGQVSSSGNLWTDPKRIASTVGLKTGDQIHASKLQANLDFLNSNPFHSTAVVYHPGQEVGQTDIELQTEDRLPVRFYTSYEDSGNASTGFDRYEAGFNWGDLFCLGQDQQLSYQYTSSGDGQSLRAQSGSYVVPLPWKHTLTFFGNYTDSKGSIPPLLGLTGRSYQISGRYSIPLPSYTLPDLGLNYRHTFAFGFDYKYNKNALQFGGIDVPTSLYDVDQFVMTYNGALIDPFGQTTISDQFYISPGNWGGNDNDTEYDMAHGGATSNYAYNTLILERLNKLPYNATLVLRGTLQTSNANLAPSEQLGFGGYDTVRGYDEREVNNDEGYIFTTELRAPPVSLGDIFKSKSFRDQFQVLGFWDYGTGYNHRPLASETPNINLSSVGFGLRYSINTYFTFRFDYGFQLVHTGFDDDHGSRTDMGISLSY